MSKKETYSDPYFESCYQKDFQSFLRKGYKILLSFTNLSSKEFVNTWYSVKE